MSQQDMYEKAIEIASDMNGEYTHMEASGVGGIVWIHCNFNDNRDINIFMSQLHTNNIGYVIRNTGHTSCAVLI